MASHHHNFTGYATPSKHAASKHASSNTAPTVKTGTLSVTLVVEDLKFVPEKQAYEIEIGDAFVVSSNRQKGSIKICLSTSKMKKINRELADPEMDKLLDEIEDQNEFLHNRDKTLLSLQPRNIKKEWGKISQKQPSQFTPTTPNDPSSPFPQTFDKKPMHPHNQIESFGALKPATEPVIFEEMCSFYIGQCVNIERIIFIMKYYREWRRHKVSKTRNTLNNESNIKFESMTEFIASLNYTKMDLMNDYLHVKKCHFSNDLIGFFRDKLQENECKDTDTSTCICMDRNTSDREIYSLSKQHRAQLYWIDNRIMKEGSLHEIREMNLQRHLDVIHCSLIHNALSDGSKFISEISKYDANDSDEKVVYDEFGLYFDYWKENRKDFCLAKYPNLKSELLNNKLHSISWNDFNCVYEIAKDFLETEFAKYSMNAKREFDAMKNAVKYGENISMDHVISIITYTNYKGLSSALKNGCKRIKSKEKKQEVMCRNMECANWCRFLKESIYYFGDLLADKERLFHGVNKKLMFQRVAKKFNLPMSTTTSFAVANTFATQNGICLHLGKMFALEENNLYLDVSYFSDFPNEFERVIYGGRLGFVDIIYNSMSHADQVISLRLYQKIIDGDWFSQNDTLFTKKYQNEIIHMIQYMMNVKENEFNANNNDSDVYIQQLFECIVENVGFGTKTIWINQEECGTLMPDLNKLFFQTFLPFLRKYYKIRMKYCNLMNMKIKHEALMSSSRQYQLYSSEYRFSANEESMAEIELHFRCYRQYDQVKNEDVLMAKFELKTLPKTISSVKMYGGLWFPQIAFDRWDYCTLSHSKMSQGCPLFSLERIKEIDTLRIEICFQVYRVYDQYGNRLKL